MSMIALKAKAFIREFSFGVGMLRFTVRSELASCSVTNTHETNAL